MFSFSFGDVRNRLPKKGFRTFLKSTAAITNDAIVANESLEDVWEMLQIKLQSAVDDAENVREPVLTFYRDTNGWCPFCERVWICMRAKNLSYDETLVPLFNKPDWYKQMVPTGQVPAILFHKWDGGNDENTRKLVWESRDVMKALDDAFPDTVQLVYDTEEYNGAIEQNERLLKAGFSFLSLDGQEEGEDAEKVKGEKRDAFISSLNEIDQSLQNSGGPFRLGSKFTGVDAEMIPMLERWRYQLPLKDTPLNILEGRPYLQKWFEAMESFEPYSGRVMGDEYSWVATNSVFAKFFGGTENEIKVSEEKASGLIKNMSDSRKCQEKFALEAAAKILKNNDAIINDCTNIDPKSQLNLIRSGNVENAKHLLQYVAELLLNGDDAIDCASSSPLSQDLETLTVEEKKDASVAAKTIASRLCVPRDMSAPAAEILRSILITVAARLVI